MNVTFDSNVFQHVVRPDKFPRDKDVAHIRAIHEALKAGTVKGFVAETMADLEAIKRTERVAYFSGAKSSAKIEETELPGGKIKIGITVGAKPAAHPGVPSILKDRFDDAINLGFKFMRCPRIGLPRPQVLKDSWFAAEPSAAATSSRLDGFMAAGRAIEDRGVGIAIVKSIGTRLNGTNPDHKTWFEGLASALSSQEQTAVADAVGEWADGDSVATHIGYGNEFFCTRDRAVAAGKSILNVANRQWLSSEYGVVFVDIEELAAKIQLSAV